MTYPRGAGSAPLFFRPGGLSFLPKAQKERTLKASALFCVAFSVPASMRSSVRSDVEPEVDHVAVLDHILLALAAQQALFLGGVDAAAADHVVVGDDLGPDEAPLDVGVDLSGGLRSLGALADGPGPALVLAVGQEGDQAQQIIAALD